VQAVIDDIQKISAWIKVLQQKINDAQEICYLNDMYGILYNTDKMYKNQDRIKKSHARKEEQRKLRAKRERERRSVVKDRNKSLNQALQDASRRNRWNNI